MTLFEKYEKKHSAIKKQLLSVEVDGAINCETIGHHLKVSGQTVRNYLSGKIKDGYLAESILEAAKKIKR